MPSDKNDPKKNDPEKEVLNALWDQLAFLPMAESLAMKKKRNIYVVVAMIWSLITIFGLYEAAMIMYINYAVNHAQTPSHLYLFTIIWIVASIGGASGAVAVSKKRRKILYTKKENKEYYEG